MRYINPRFVAILIALPWSLTTPCQATFLDPPDSELQTLLIKANDLGITPSSLVVTDIAGSQTEPVTIILSRLQSASSTLATLEAQEDLICQHGATITHLRQQLTVEGGDTSLAQEYAAAVANLQAARSQADTTRADLLDVVLEGVPPGQAQGITLWQNTLLFDVPASFRVLELTEDEWQTITGALRAEQIALHDGVEFTGPEATLLASIRNDQAVIEAENRLALYLASVELAFEQFELPIE